MLGTPVSDPAGMGIIQKRAGSEIGVPTGHKPASPRKFALPGRAADGTLRG